ncbi:hypothetical protein OG21DRAFT_1491041 [Imleria badia]|nr:hypothetical protein OG21DRAFT_1491041 [Imleria badia]
MAQWWNIVDGISLRTAQADAAAMALWESNDRQAQAMITMIINANMQHLQKDTYVAFVDSPANQHLSLSKDLWDQLNALYSSAGIVGQFKAFSEALCIQIQDPNEGHHHGPTSDERIIASQITKLMSTYDKMTSASLMLPENLKAMILLNSLPSSYHSLVSTIMQTTTVAQFTLDNVIPKVQVVSKEQLRHTSQSNRLPPYNTLPPSPLALIVAKVMLVTVAGKCMAIPDSPIPNHDNSQVMVTNLIDPTLALEVTLFQTEGITDITETTKERVTNLDDT